MKFLSKNTLIAATLYFGTVWGLYGSESIAVPDGKTEQ